MSTEEKGTAVNFSVAMVTAPSMEVAQSLSRNIIQRKLAACVNIIPQVVSIYEWQGNIEESSECLMMIKTQSRHIPELTSFVLAHHPYKVPEVISLKISEGNEAYLKWIEQSTQK
eukprot:Em0018g32a